MKERALIREYEGASTGSILVISFTFFIKSNSFSEIGSS
jgi:hypothetical protein